jgi:hypothetical protein
MKYHYVTNLYLHPDRYIKMKPYFLKKEKKNNSTIKWCKTNMLTILMHQMRFSTTQFSSVMLSSKKLEIRKCENWESRRMKTKQSAMKLSQIRRRIYTELCLREIILRFDVNLQNLLLYWQFNSYSYSKASTEVLSNWAVETLGD